MNEEVDINEVKRSVLVFPANCLRGSARKAMIDAAKVIWGYDQSTRKAYVFFGEQTIRIEKISIYDEAPKPGERIIIDCENDTVFPLVAGVVLHRKGSCDYASDAPFISPVEEELRREQRSKQAINELLSRTRRRRNES